MIAHRSKKARFSRDCFSATPGVETVRQEPIKDPARLPWHEVKKVDHYYLSVDALTQPMTVREDSPPYGD